jgi:hypothetical protein
MNHKSTLGIRTHEARHIDCRCKCRSYGRFSASGSRAQNPACENGHHPSERPPKLGTRLSPGKYRVKITPASDESGNPTVQFSILHNPYGDDSNPPNEEVGCSHCAGINGGFARSGRKH